MKGHYGPTATPPHGRSGAWPGGAAKVGKEPIVTDSAPITNDREALDVAGHGTGSAIDVDVREERAL